MNKKSVYRNQEKTVRNLQKHFSFLRNASANCRSIFHFCKMPAQIAEAFSKLVDSVFFKSTKIIYVFIIPCYKWKCCLTVRWGPIYKRKRLLTVRECPFTNGNGVWQCESARLQMEMVPNCEWKSRLQMKTASDSARVSVYKWKWRLTVSESPVYKWKWPLTVRESPFTNEIGLWQCDEVPFTVISKYYSIIFS